MDTNRRPKTQPEGGVDPQHQAAASQQHIHATSNAYPSRDVYESFGATPGEEVTYLVPVWPKKESVEKLLRTIANRYKAAANTVIGFAGLGADLLKGGGGGKNNNYNYSPDAPAPAPATYAEEDDIVTSYDPVVDHRTTYQADPSAPAAAAAAAAAPTAPAHPYFTTFESHPYYTYFEPSPYRIPTEDETYAEWYYQEQQQQQEATGGNAASVTYQQNHIPQAPHDKSSPLHEIEPEAPTKLSHALYTTEAAAPAPAPTSYFYDSRIQQQHQQQHPQQQHPQQQHQKQQQQQQQEHQQQLRPLTNSLSGGFQSQKLNELRQKYTSPPQRPTAASTTASTASTVSEDDESAVDPEAITTSAPRVTVSVSKSVTTSVRRVTSDGVTLITPLGDTGESEKLQVD